MEGEWRRGLFSAFAVIHSRVAGGEWVAKEDRICSISRVPAWRLGNRYV